MPSPIRKENAHTDKGAQADSRRSSRNGAEQHAPLNLENEDGKASGRTQLSPGNAAASNSRLLKEADKSAQADYRRSFRNVAEQHAPSNVEKEGATPSDKTQLSPGNAAASNSRLLKEADKSAHADSRRSFRNGAEQNAPYELTVQHEGATPSDRTQLSPGNAAASNSRLLKEASATLHPRSRQTRAELSALLNTQEQHVMQKNKSVPKDPSSRTNSPVSPCAVSLSSNHDKDDANNVSDHVHRRPLPVHPARSVATRQSSISPSIDSPSDVVSVTSASVQEGGMLPMLQTQERSDNKLVRPLREMIAKYGFVLIFLSIAQFFVSVIQGSVNSQRMPPWIKRIPCVLQDEFMSIQTFSQGVERYFLFMDMIPPIAATVLILKYFKHIKKQDPYFPQNLLRGVGKTESAETIYTKPLSLRNLLFIWLWRIATPLAVFMFFQMKSFLGSDEISQKMCEISLSLALYPTTPTPLVNSSLMTLREVAKKYFNVSSNLLYPEQDFEGELSGISVENPESKPLYDGDCRADPESDAFVYTVFEHYFKVDDAITSYCRKAISVGKSFGYKFFDSAIFAITIFSKHLSNIVAGINFSYTFCDAEYALGNQNLSDKFDVYDTSESMSFRTVCSEWAKAKNYTSEISPTVLRYLDPDGVWKQEESKDNASLTMAESAYYARLSSEVDLSGTRFSREAAVQPETRQPTLRFQFRNFIEKSEPTILLLSSMLESWKRLPFNINIHKQGLSSVLCPDVIKDLRESFPVCAQQQSSKAKRVCQYETANLKLRDRVIKFSSEQEILSRTSSSADFFPANFTEFSVFVGRIVKKLLDPILSKTNGMTGKVFFSYQTYAAFFSLQKFISDDSMGKVAAIGQSSSFLLSMDQRRIIEDAKDVVNADFEQVAMATHKYLFAMTPAGVSQIGITDFYGLCDSTTLSCTTEMSQNNVCNCMTSQSDLYMQVRYAMMDARTRFNDIDFFTQVNTADHVGNFIAESVKGIKVRNEGTTQTAILQACVEILAKSTASMASASRKAQYLMGLFLDVQAMKLVPIAMALQFGLLHGFMNYHRITIQSGVIEDGNDMHNFRLFTTAFFITGVFCMVLPVSALHTFVFQGVAYSMMAAYVFVLSAFGVVFTFVGNSWWALRSAPDGVGAERLDQSAKVFLDQDKTLLERSRIYIRLSAPSWTKFASYIFIIAGFFAWIDSDKASLLEDDQIGTWIASFVIGNIWNFVFSAIASSCLTSYAMGWMFKDYHKVWYLDTRKQSHLWMLNLHDLPAGSTPSLHPEESEEEAKVENAAANATAVKTPAPQRDIAEESLEEKPCTQRGLEDEPGAQPGESEESLEKINSGRMQERKNQAKGRKGNEPKNDGPSSEATLKEASLLDESDLQKLGSISKSLEKIKRLEAVELAESRKSFFKSLEEEKHFGALEEPSEDTLKEGHLLGPSLTRTPANIECSDSKGHVFRPPLSRTSAKIERPENVGSQMGSPLTSVEIDGVKLYSDEPFAIPKNDEQYAITITSSPEEQNTKRKFSSSQTIGVTGNDRKQLQL